jgi:hypothetical protein
MDNSEVADLYQTKSNTDYAYDGQYIHVESVGWDVKGECDLVNNADVHKRWIRFDKLVEQSAHLQLSV